MGCTSSKQKRCRHCQAPYSPIPRSYSMHVHHPVQHKGDSYHVVALTSTTLDTLKLDDNHQNNGSSINVAAFSGNLETGTKINGDVKKYFEEEGKELAMEVIEAKVWSKMIKDKISKVVPKTPIRTPPGEPETINTWEMMAGLEDISPLRSPPGHFRSFSFDVVRNISAPKENGSVSPKPMWLQIEENDDQISDSGITDFDPEIISSFRKSLEQLPPDNPFHLRPQENEKEQDYEKKVNEVVVVVSDCKLNNKDKVVVYFTSLRGVRKTYEDCCHVRVILKSVGIRIDERDVSMHSGFKEELKELMGERFKGGLLPRVFVGGKDIGGAEEIRQMHEEGQLEKAVQGCEMVDDESGACEACGDFRFVPCETCSGSCKVYYEDVDNEEEEEEENEGEGEEGEFGFQSCPDCNENGLIRCPICCY